MKTTLTPHLRIRPYKGSVATVQIQMPFRLIIPILIIVAEYNVTVIIAHCIGGSKEPKDRICARVRAL